MTIISTAIPDSYQARAVGVKTEFQNLTESSRLLPQRVGIVGQGTTAATYSTDKRRVFSALEVGQIYGFGSPLHLAALELLPANNDGIGAIPLTVYPLDDGTTESDGTITPTAGPQSETQEYVVKINEIRSEPIVIPATTIVSAVAALMVAGINAINEMPMIAVDNAGVVELTSKWKGASANDLFIEIEGTVAGITFAIVQPASGAGNPDVQDALDQLGDVWETLLLNCLEIADTTNLAKYSTVGEGRWLPIKPKPFVAVTGNTEADVSTAVTVSDSRSTDRVNAQLVAPGSRELPFVVAARELARIAKIANENPPVGYALQKADGLVPGTDAEQWTDIERDFALKKGSSSIELIDGVINLSDTITFYHPTGDPTPAYRYVVDIMKIMNVVYNVRLIFEDPDWAGAVLIPSGQATSNPRAKSPSMAIAEIARMIDSLAEYGILSDPEFAKATIVAEISAINPKRLDISFTYQISGNVNQISIDARWGFYFGGSQLAA
ncbi:MAG: phage tail protein [Deltaproteobacteria bacterium]|nr:phage tail protein [Deltaproteobacteria bacterium]